MVFLLDEQRQSRWQSRRWGSGGGTDISCRHSAPCDKTTTNGMATSQHVIEWNSAVGSDLFLPIACRSERLPLEHGQPAKAASCPAPRTSRLIMKRRIYRPIAFECSPEPPALRVSVRRRMPGQTGGASEAETPCFEGVEPCESSGGNFRFLATFRG